METQLPSPVIPFSGQSEPRAYEQRLRAGGDWAVQETSDYPMQQGSLYQTLHDLVRRLEEAHIPYALIGGVSLAQHGYVRATEDLNILVTPEGLAKFRERWEGRGYVPAFPGARKAFRATETGVRVEFVTAGEYPGDGRPKPVCFPDPEVAAIEVEGVRVIGLEKLLELKLASGASAPHRRRDLADVQDLIRVLGLPEKLGHHWMPACATFTGNCGLKCRAEIRGPRVESNISWAHLLLCQA